MNNRYHDRQTLGQPNLNKTYEHKDNSEILMHNSGFESNDPNIVSNRNGKIVKEG